MICSKEMVVAVPEAQVPAMVVHPDAPTDLLATEAGVVDLMAKREARTTSPKPPKRRGKLNSRISSTVN